MKYNIDVKYAFCDVYLQMIQASPAFVATGQGAFATGTPSPAPSSISLLPLTSTTISQITTSTSAAPSATVSSSSSSKSDSHLGPIVGGSVGGAGSVLFHCRISLTLTVDYSGSLGFNHHYIGTKEDLQASGS